MIEVVSTQAEIEIDPDRNTSYYLELYGETRPALASNYAQVLPAGPLDGSAQTTQVTPIYEYWWTIGHELDIYYENATHLLGRGPRHSHGFWENLGEVDGAAARVYLYFPVNSNWRIKELTATLKYLSPAPEQHTWFHDLLAHWQHATPVLQDASNIARLIPTPATAAAAEGLAALAKLQLNSVPPSQDINWSAMKVTHGKAPDALMQGVVWSLPQSVFTRLGSRITGSLALSFIPAHMQDPDSVLKEAAPPKPAALEAHAVVYGRENKKFWAPGPGSGKWLRLMIEPVDPQVVPAASQGSPTSGS
jgi:hypothetical protein